MVGGNLRLMATGGAPVSADTHNFVRNCFCCPLLQAYGLTETAAAVTMADENDLKSGHVGAPTVGVSIMLEDWPEGGYHATDKPHPRGEILIGGDMVSKGYYLMEEKTREDFFEKDGIRYFRSGDIGEILDNGCIKIIDRKKDLVKLQFGEYVSFGKLEAEYKTLSIVDNICTYGDSTQNYVVALVVPNLKQLHLLATQLNMEDKSHEELCTDPTVEKTVLQMMTQHGVKTKLVKQEIPQRVKLVTEIWTPDSGLVTAAYKLKRKAIQDKYQHLIDQMYSKK
jgi:long-chain acyl-CoA synthetase